MTTLRRSLVSARTWRRPFAPGVLRVYDEALKFIRHDSAALKIKANQLRVALAAPSTTQIPETDRERMRQEVRKLELESEINLPHIRWKIANGLSEFLMDNSMNNCQLNS